MDKYNPLGSYLEKQNMNQIKLSYEEIEIIIGDKLPVTASNNKAWWSNNDRSHVQSAAWSDAGYLVSDITLGAKVTFTKGK